MYKNQDVESFHVIGTWKKHSQFNSNIDAILDLMKLLIYLP